MYTLIMSDDSLVQFSHTASLSCPAGTKMVKVESSGMYKCETDLEERREKERELSYILNEHKRLTAVLQSLENEGLLLPSDTVYIKQVVGTRGRAAFDDARNNMPAAEAQKLKIQTEIDVLHDLMREYLDTDAIKSEHDTLRTRVVNEIPPEIIAEIEDARSKSNRMLAAAVGLVGVAFMV